MSRSPDGTGGKRREGAELDEEENVTDRPHDDDRAAEAVLAALEAGREADLPEGGTDVDATLRRLYLETLGLVAYDATPCAPRPEVEERLLAAVAERAAGASRMDRDAPAAAESGGVVPFEPRAGEEDRAAGEAPEAADEAPAAALEAGARRPQGRDGGSGGRGKGWITFLAAVLALAAVGLAGFLWQELESSRAALAQLESERTRLLEELDSRGAAAAEAGSLAELVAAAATPGVEVCPMRPVGTDPVVPEASAMVYIPPEGPEWFLVAHGLEAPGEGAYRVWINTAAGAMPAGVLEPGRRSTLRMPAGMIDPEDMLSVTVTLESDPEPSGPDGPMVLFGDQMVQLL